MTIEVMSPDRAERARREEVQREAMVREAYRWRALAHVLIVFAALAVMAFASVLCAVTFGVYETALGLLATGIASIIAFIYIHNAPPPKA